MVARATYSTVLSLAQYVNICAVRFGLHSVVRTGGRFERSNSKHRTAFTACLGASNKHLGLGELAVALGTCEAELPRELLQQLLARGDLLRRPADVQHREACPGRIVAMMPGTRQSSIMLLVTFVVRDRNVDTSSLPSSGCASI